MSDSTYSGKPLTMPPGKFEEMEQYMENAALDEVRQEGYQAGLKRAAAIAINMYPEAAEINHGRATLQLNHVIALGIEQAILRELSEDAPSSSDSLANSGSKTEGPSGQKRKK